MSEVVTHVDGCEYCGNRATVSPEHVANCEAFHERRREARVHGEQFGIPAVCVDDLFAHLTTPRAAGALCTAERAVAVVHYVAALGWRPVSGPKARDEVETREPVGGVR